MHLHPIACRPDLTGIVIRSGPVHGRLCKNKEVFALIDRFADVTYGFDCSFLADARFIFLSISSYDSTASSFAISSTGFSYKRKLIAGLIGRETPPLALF